MSNPNYSQQKEQTQAEKEAIKTRRQESEGARHKEQGNIRRMEEANKEARGQKINNTPEKERGYTGFIHINPNNKLITDKNIIRADKELNLAKSMEEKDRKEYGKYILNNPGTLDEGVYKGFIHVNPKKRPDGKVMSIDEIKELKAKQLKELVNSDEYL